MASSRDAHFCPARAVPGRWLPGAAWPINLNDVAREIVAVFAVHTDTASGITSDMAALRATIDATGHPALLVVDAVASAGCTRVAMHELRANVVLGASQKGLMTPPGVGWLAVDAQAAAVAAQNPAPRFHWDWRLRHSPLSCRRFCGTPPQTLMAGLAAAFGLIHRPWSVGAGSGQPGGRRGLIGLRVSARCGCWCCLQTCRS